MSTYIRRVYRSRSPRGGSARNGRFRRQIRSRAPFNHDNSKFDDSPREERKLTIVNQLTTEALWKESRSQQTRFKYAGQPRLFNENKLRYFGDLNNSNRSRRGHDSLRNRNDRRGDERRKTRVKRYDDSAFKINDAITAPRGGYYFQHDNRSPDASLGSYDRRLRDNSKRKYNFSRDGAGLRSDRTNRIERRYVNDSKDHRKDIYGQKRLNSASSTHETVRNYGLLRGYSPDRRDRSDRFWRHDKFQELVKEEKEENPEENNNRHKSLSS